MCGIIGVVGREDASAVILDALKRLEYRGYDSAGVATLNGGAVERRRAVGKLSVLAALLAHEPVGGAIGIGHTRWATHGAPNEVNAHPHMAGPVAVVHNGIIENFRELREELTAKGRVFETETDTEVVAHLCAWHLANGLSPEDAAAATLARLHGAFALCFIFEGREDLMIAARRGSPLAVGHGEGEMYVGSDALALAPLTSRITYLEEGDWAVLTRAGATIHDALGNLANREMRHVNVDQVVVDKGTHRHFMAKEIHEQPSVVAFALSNYMNPSRTAVEMPRQVPDFSTLDRLVLVACGTAFYACNVAKYWFEQIARIPVEIDIASEFRYREPPLTGREGAVFVSQSGETADTLAALRYASGAAAAVLAVVNVPESSIAREADATLQIMAGPEIGVASTKAFTCQLSVLAVLAIHAARQRGHLDADGERQLTAALSTLPRAMSGAIGLAGQIAHLARDLAKARDILFLGRGALYPLALEGALKLKEISYIHAEGYASGELKHGPIALIDDTVPVICFAPVDGLFDKTVSNMQEVLARGGRVLLVTDAEGAAAASEGVWKTLVMPKADPFVAPILYAVPAQLLAYYTAVEKGTDVDQPRNLAKSVTVE
ncbi:MAG: glutamine--fructose-6-phosphate transaminase (isomerizing) [Paracoccaceae bacterium]